MPEFIRGIPKPLLGVAAAVLLLAIAGGLVFLQSGGDRDGGGAGDLAAVAQVASCAPSDAPGSAFALTAEAPDTVLDETEKLTGWSRQLQDNVDGAIIACSLAIYATIDAAHAAYLDRVSEIEANDFSTTLVAGDVRPIDAPPIGDESTAFEAEADSGSTRHAVFVVFRQGRATGSAQLRELKTGFDADAVLAVGQAMASRLHQDGSAAVGAPPAAQMEDAKSGGDAEAVSETTPAAKCWQRGPAQIETQENNWPNTFTVTVDETSATGSDNGLDAPGLNGSRFSGDIGNPRGTSRTTTLRWEVPPNVICEGDSVPMSVSASGDTGGLFGARYRMSYVLEDTGFTGSFLPGDFVWVRYDPAPEAEIATLTLDSEAVALITGNTVASFQVSVDITGPNADAAVRWAYAPGGQLPEANPPLIFIPGVTGSQLVGADGQILWPPEGPGASRATTDLTQDFVRLSLNPASAHEAITVTDVIRADGPKDQVYGPLLNYLSVTGGYEEYIVDDNPARRTAAGCDMTQKTRQPTLFVFAYDWRKSNVDSANALADYVGCVQRFYPGRKVDILAHSMGGLIARRYIIDNPGKVDRLITVATPFLGSPKPLYQILNGTTGIGWKDTLTGQIYGQELRDMLEYYPGVHELMSSRAYFELGGRPFAIQHPDDETGKPVETYDELMGQGGVIDGLLPRSSYNKKTPAQSNRDFHDYKRNGNAQDDWSNDSTGVRYFHIVGVQRVEATPLNLNELHSFIGASAPETITYDPEVFGFGDGTVPLTSAQRTGQKDLNAPDARVVVFDGESGDADDLLEHTGLVTNPRVQRQVLDWLLAKD